MKLLGNVAVWVKGEVVLRQPRFWEKVKKVFGGEPDLTTGRIKATLEAGAVVDAVRDALNSLGATNAVSLVVDDLVLFQDKEGRPDDLGDLFLAFHEQSSAIDEFKLLRLAVEHVEAGLHLLIEVQARGEHAADEPTVRVVIAGRIHALEPKKGESAEAYRARVEPLAGDKAMIDVSRLQFESFCERVRDAIQAAMPEARAQVKRAEAQVQRPGRPAQDQQRMAQPDAPGYDPFFAYYPDPMYSMLNMMMWSSIFSMAMHPNVVVVNEAGDTVGHVDTPNIEHADPVPAEAGGDVGDGGDGGDAGGDLGGDAGADVGGGDIDVGDAGGGFDFGDFGFD